MKKRHIKTFLEKYPIYSVSDECWEFIEKYRKHKTDFQIFNEMPYIGIFYLPFNIMKRSNKIFSNSEIFDYISNEDNTIIYSEYYGNMKKCKIYEVDNETVRFFLIDSHDRNLLKSFICVEDFLLEGNVIQ